MSITEIMMAYDLFLGILILAFVFIFHWRMCKIEKRVKDLEGD